jgi:hypothetical protein
MGFDCTFSSDNGDCDVWIEDDGRVGYAYILDAQGKICGDVWLYNRAPAPPDFEQSDQEAGPRNPAPYVNADVHFALPSSADDFSVDWMQQGSTAFARVFIRDRLAALLAKGTRPGWSALAKRDGPVAKVLPSQSASRGATETATTTAAGASTSMVELHDPGDGRNVLIEVTRNNHRRGKNFRRHHPWAGQNPPHPIPRRPRSVFRKIWEKDWDEGRFDGLKEQ